jgi:hypothetical protein
VQDFSVQNFWLPGVGAKGEVRQGKNIGFRPWSERGSMGCGFHDLLHSAASLMIANKVPPHSHSKEMAHAQ